ncbi:Rz1-like lysis system protein LysC [Candidatus Pantoea formicae]|uniref:Rz1-like lysis system protein LysC n=1 Tax=Candidatus Pantoea formicae TaxID=2608355 RepID=UPI00402AC979
MSTGWWLSGGWLKATTVPLSLCLLTQLSSCVRTEIRHVDTTPSPIPAALLADCPVPDIPEPFTWGDSLVLNERLLTSLLTCNNDKAAIRESEKIRNNGRHKDNRIE